MLAPLAVAESVAWEEEVAEAVALTGDAVPTREVVGAAEAEV